MKRMKFACGAALAVLSVASAAFAIVPSQLTANQPHGFRGNTVTYKVNLSAGGSPCANQVVYFFDRSDARPSWRYLGSAVTDGQGFARLPYRIPTSPSEDNVHLLGQFCGTGAASPSAVDKRIEIGR